MSRAVLLALGLAACGASEPSPGPTAVPLVNRPTGPATPADAATAVDAPPSACVADCVRARQMQATSIETITRQCEDSCASPPPP